ncbi:MAG: DUF4157 domain-containing protein [Acidobacteriota bacterium]
MSEESFINPSSQTRLFENNQGWAPSMNEGNQLLPDVGGETYSSPQPEGSPLNNYTEKPFSWTRYAQKAATDKGDYFSSGGKLYHQREDKVFQVTGEPQGDYEINGEEISSLKSQGSSGQQFRANPVSTDGSGSLGSPPAADDQTLGPKTPKEVRKLTEYERRMMKEAGFTDEQLDPITLHIGGGHPSMPKSMDAITYDDNIYFRDGVHDPNSAKGLAFLAHEIQHSVQWRNGMTVPSYVANSVGGYKNNKYEKDAFECQADAYQRIREKRLQDLYESYK